MGNLQNADFGILERGEAKEFVDLGKDDPQLLCSEFCDLGIKRTEREID